MCKKDSFMGAQVNGHTQAQYPPSPLDLDMAVSPTPTKRSPLLIFLRSGDSSVPGIQRDWQLSGFGELLEGLAAGASSVVGHWLTWASVTALALVNSKDPWESKALHYPVCFHNASRMGILVVPWRKLSHRHTEAYGVCVCHRESSGMAQICASV